MSTYQTIHNLMGELRVARALINDQIRGSNDPKNDIVKDWDRAIAEGEKEAKAILNDTNIPHL